MPLIFRTMLRSLKARAFGDRLEARAFPWTRSCNAVDWLGRVRVRRGRVACSVRSGKEWNEFVALSK